MRQHKITGAGFHASFLANCGIGGVRVCLDNPERVGSDVILRRVNETHTETKSLLDKVTEDVGGINSRLQHLEQKSGRLRGGGGGGDPEASLGTRFVASDGFKAFQAGGQRGTGRMELERKAITSGIGSAAALITPDYRTDVVTLPRRTMTIRALIAPGATISNMVFYARQTLRNLAAAAVAENPSASKPESTFAFEQVSAAVKTIAHWVAVSKQAADDAPALAALIDSEMRYGLDEAEERQLLFGTGMGEDLLGIMPQASPFVAPFTVSGATKLDVILQAIAQAELALLPATGIVLNPVDWATMQGLKDAQGRYIGGGPFAALDDRIWTLPKVVTPVMPVNSFLVGAFQAGAQIFDRQTAEVLISSEDRDNFVKNMLTVRAEERLALAVKRPQAFIRGTFPTT